jgi:hypothetical protein
MKLMTWIRIGTFVIMLACLFLQLTTIRLARMAIKNQQAAIFALQRTVDIQSQTIRILEGNNVNRKARYVIQQSALGRWIIVHPEDDGLAWSGTRWVGHIDGVPNGEAQVCNFSTGADAWAYARERRIE